MIGTGLAILGAGLLGAGAYRCMAPARRLRRRTRQQGCRIQQQAMDFQKQNYDSCFEEPHPVHQYRDGANNLLASFYGLNGSDPALGQCS
jgi:hypothetical protein